MVPKTWKDLADPKYKDKLAQGNPRASGTSAVIDHDPVKLCAWQHFEALTKNNIMTQQSRSQPSLISSGG
jgi:ABC-type Fe3+ transport system substrate-binding protein